MNECISTTVDREGRAMSPAPEAERKLPTGLSSGSPAGGAAAEAPHDDGSRGLVKSPFDLAGGLFLVGLAVLGLAGGFNLPTGTLSGIGSGLLPRAVSILVGAFGVLLIVQSLLFEGDRLEKWHLRGPVFVLGAVLVFAMLVRGSTLNFGGIFGIPVLASVKVPALGLIVAGPLAVIVSAFAAKDTRPREIVVFAIAMTLFSGLLFKEMLNLPIPYDPFGIVPGPVSGAYAAVKSALGHGVDAIKSLFVR
jgi:putative tricarboxylic transport membrane protein